VLAVPKSNLLLAGQGRPIICCETKGNAGTNELCPARSRHIVSIPQSPNFAGHVERQAAANTKSATQGSYSSSHFSCRGFVPLNTPLISK